MGEGEVFEFGLAVFVFLRASCSRDSLALQAPLNFPSNFSSHWPCKALSLSLEPAASFPVQDDWYGYGGHKLEVEFKQGAARPRAPWWPQDTKEKKKEKEALLHGSWEEEQAKEKERKAAQAKERQQEKERAAGEKKEREAAGTVSPTASPERAPFQGKFPEPPPPPSRGTEDQAKGKEVQGQQPEGEQQP